MHRIPLVLTTPTVLWERNLPEWVLFERTLNKRNVEETDTYFRILDSEAEFYKSQCYGMAEDMYTSAQQFMSKSTSTSFADAMFLINSIILRTPKDSKVLAQALKIRGNYNFHGCSFQHASSDYEMYLQVIQFGKCENDDICEIYGHLMICMYMMGQFFRVKQYFRSYKKYRVRIETHITKFINEMEDIANATPPHIPNDDSFVKPCNGFNLSKDIPAASSSCYFYNNGIYTNEPLPKSSIIIVEEPIMKSLNLPFVQCEVCYGPSQQQPVYTCLECRFKTYCSLGCLEKDKSTHQDECIGYKELTLLVLDASSIFRIFIKISSLLHEFIFNPKIFRKLKTAEDVWDKLLELLKDAKCPDTNYLSLIKMKPFYAHLSDTQYSTLVTTAFRLTIFIDKKTNLIEKYFKKLHVSNKQKLILVGSILMRLHCHMLLNTFDFEITKHTNNTNLVTVDFDMDMDCIGVKQIEKTIKLTKPRREVFVENINKYYNIDVEKEIWQRSAAIIESPKNRNQITLPSLPSLVHIEPCNRIHRILSTYKDNIAELYFNPELVHSLLYSKAASQPTSSVSATIICARIADMTSLDRFVFVKKFARNFHNHYSEYFLQLVENTREIQQVLSLYCPTLSKFQHSCVPNVEIIILDNNVVIGKALRNIRKGEQLFVSYKANYMQHVRMEREIFLKRLDLQCKCRCCKLNHLEEPTNLRLAIYCETCDGVEITPGHSICPKCRTQYNNLLNKYRTIITILENELKNKLKPENAAITTDRDIFILHQIIYSHAKMYFSPENEFRIKIGLRLARYLAFENFAKQSYSLIKEIRKNILKNYDENLIWFTFYADILVIMKVILWYNLEEKLYSMASSSLLDLCTFGLHIATGQKDYIEFYEIFDHECTYVLDDINVLLKWKDTILSSDFLPLSDSLNRPKQKDNSKSLNSDIPSL